jgi:hypothetical protein
LHIGIGYHQNTTKLTKDNEKEKKEKEGGNLLEIIPLDTSVDREGWKVSFLKGMYVAKQLALI